MLKHRLMFVSPLCNKTQYQLVCVAAQYLTTVIPYDKNGRPPSLEDLQVLTKSTLLMLLLLLLYTCACNPSTDSPVVHLQFWKQ